MSAAFAVCFAGDALFPSSAESQESLPGGPEKLSGPRKVFLRELVPASATDNAENPERPRRIPDQAPVEGGSAVPAAVNAADSSFAGPESAPSLSGAGFEGLDNSNNAAIAGVTVTPPDPQMAVGPNHVFEMVNIIGRIYTRTGALVQTFSLRNFFGVPAGFVDTDPKVIFDSLSNRWFASYVSFLDQAGSVNDQGRLHLAISQTNDPTGAWNVYSRAYSQVLPDYEAIAVTNDKLTVSSNIFDVDQPFFFGVETLVLEKADVMAGVPGPSVGLFAFPLRTDRFTVRPAQNLTSGNDQYLTTRANSTTLTIIKVTGTPDAGNVIEASATNRTMLAQNAPPASIALGGTIDSGDSRLLDAMWRGGLLWTSGSAACIPAGDSTNRSCAHLIEVDTNVTPPVILQDIMFGASAQYFSWPALRTDSQDDLYVSVTHTNSTVFPEARAAGRQASEPPNTMSGSILLRAGDIAHDSARWGDYLGAAVDPLFPRCVWVIGEYSKNTTGANWGTFIARTSFSLGCDADNDTWSDGAEATIGTNPALACGTNAWPADTNNDGFSDIFDIIALANNFAKSVPPAPTRQDIDPDPPDGFVDIHDISRMAAFFPTHC
jgi:hypothetical protein